MDVVALADLAVKLNNARAAAHKVVSDGPPLDANPEGARLDSNSLLSGTRDLLSAGTTPLEPSNDLATISQECSLSTVAEAVAGESPKKGKARRVRKQWATLNGGAATAKSALNIDHADDLVLTVAVCHPKKYPRTISQEFSVLGSHTLKQLYDKIICIDEMNFYGHESKPKRPAFFYIEGCFFRDIRVIHSNKWGSSSYVSELIEWLKGSKHPDLQEDPERDMNTRFVDLQIQLNVPYVLYHHGGCEHQIIISDVRLVDESDQVGPDPVPTYEAKKVRKNCQICRHFTAEFVVHNDTSLPFNPCFFCKQCEGTVDNLCGANSNSNDRVIAAYMWDS